MADLEGRAFIREGNVLAPADLAAQEYLESVPDKTKVLLSWRRPRHIENHQHFFAILHACCEQLEYADEDELLDALKMAVNHVRPVRKIDGEIVFMPKSIKFAEMQEDKFQRFKLRALHVLGQLLGVDPVTLLKEVPPMKKRNKA
jgi:hypothetical protein